MSSPARMPEGAWSRSLLPPSVNLGSGSVIIGSDAFHRFRPIHGGGLTIGANSRMEDVRFDVGEKGRVVIGDDCRFLEAGLSCVQEIVIGDRVMIGPGSVIFDTDYHPVDPSERVDDAIALSPIAGENPRPAIDSRRVQIGSDVFVGPRATILKGVEIGNGAFIEPGSVITHNVPRAARVAGNPAVVLGTV